MYWKDRAIEPWYSDPNWKEASNSFIYQSDLYRPSYSNFSIDLYSGTNKLSSYDSLFFWYDYSVWETQLRYADPSDPSRTGTCFIKNYNSNDSIDYSHYHGQFLGFVMCIPRYYEYGGKYYDILKLQPLICSSNNGVEINYLNDDIVNFASNPKYEAPYSATCKSYLLSSPDEVSGNDLMSSFSEVIDGVANYYSAGSHTIQNSPVSYIYFDVPYVNYHAYILDNNSDIENSYLRRFFTNNDLAASNYVFLDFVFGVPYIVPFGLSAYQSTDFDDIQFLLVNQLYDFMHWNTNNGQDPTYLEPLIDVSDASVIENYLYDPQAPVIDIFKYYYSPYINLYMKIGLFLNNLRSNDAILSNDDRSRDDRFSPWCFVVGDRFATYNDINVWFEADLQLSEAEITNATLVNSLSNLQMSVDNQTEFLRSPTPVNTAAVNSLTSDFQDSAGKLNHVTDSTDLSGFQADVNFVDNNIDVLLNGIDSGLIGTAFSFVNHNSGVILTLMTISISCVVLGYVVFGKKS